MAKRDPNTYYGVRITDKSCGKPHLARESVSLRSGKCVPVPVLLTRRREAEEYKAKGFPRTRCSVHRVRLVLMP